MKKRSNELKKNESKVDFKQVNIKKKNNKQRDELMKDNIFSYLLFKPYILILLFSVLIYSQSLFFDFVNFDDNKIKNEVITSIGGIENIFKVFSQSYGNFYRPLQTALFVVEKAIGGDEPFIYHFSNLVIHIIACLLIVILFKKMKYSDIIAGIAGLIYSVHPMFTHSIVWIPSRGDVLLTIFTALCFIWFIDYKEKNNWKNTLLCWVAYFFALLSKETAIVIPAVVLGYWLLIEKKNLFTAKNMILAGGWIGITVLWFMMRNASLTGDINVRTIGFDFFLLNLQMLPEMLSKFIYPFNIAVMPTFTNEKLIIGMIAIVAAAVGYYINKERRGNYALFGIVWFLLFLFPVMFFRLPNAEHYYDYLDHRIYLPMIGAFILLFEILPKRWFGMSNILMYIIIFGLLIVWGILAYFQTGVYKNPETFWSDGLKDNPDRAMYHYGMGLAYKIRLGQIEDSLTKFMNDIPQERRQTINNDRMRYGDQAVKHFRASLLLDSTTRDVALELGELYYKQQDFKNAIMYFERAKAENPASKLIDVNLAVSYASVGQVGKAIDMLKKVVAEHPDEIDAFFNLYVSYKVINDFDNAFKTAKHLETLGEVIDWSDYYASYAKYLLDTGNLSRALENSSMALQINPSSPLANLVNGICYINTGRDSEGIALINRSVELFPNNTEALNFLYNYYMRTKNIAEADRINDKLNALAKRQ